MITFPIHETFQKTVQGEGLFSGTAADFIRLGGCPVGCSWCDTGYAKGSTSVTLTRKTVPELIAELCSPLVVITGGEPFIHKKLPVLVSALLEANKKVAIETSGSFWLEVDSRAWITLSPKYHISSDFPVIEEMWHRADEVKLVISKGDEYLFYQPYLVETTPLFFQPEWYSHGTSLPITLDLINQVPHARLSVQLHKFIGVQ
jgi:7-carboxy-7-deazaguanine synthase